MITNNYRYQWMEGASWLLPANEMWVSPASSSIMANNNRRFVACEPQFIMIFHMRTLPSAFIQILVECMVNAQTGTTEIKFPITRMGKE